MVQETLWGGAYATELRHLEIFITNSLKFKNERKGNIISHNSYLKFHIL